VVPPVLAMQSVPPRCHTSSPFPPLPILPVLPNLSAVVSLPPRKRPCSSEALGLLQAVAASVSLPILLPSWFPKLAPRAGPRVHLSAVAQMDGIVYALLGVRLEHDLFAPSLALAFCENWGLLPSFSWSSSVKLFYPRPEELDVVVATAMSHQACGLFIFPSACADGREIFPLRKPSSKTTPPGRQWHVSLRENALLSFELEGFGLPLSAVFAGFNYAGRFKSKRRPEKFFSIGMMAAPPDDGHGKLATLPFAPSRCSPLADDIFAKAAAKDSCAPTPVWKFCDIPLPLDKCPDLWNRDAFNKVAKDYPFGLVANIAIDAVSKEGLNIRFLGDPGKAVVRENSPNIRGRESVVREHLLKEVVARRMAGPFPRPPFPSVVSPVQPRTCPLDLTPKKKHDPANTDFRLVSNFASGRPASVNDQIWSPKLIGFHLRACHLRDFLARGGPKAKMWAGDIPKCFRGQRNPEYLLPLFVYRLCSPDQGAPDEFYVDLMNAFGFTPSEWGWQCVLQITKWAMFQAGVFDCMAFVDNYFLGSLDSEDHSARVGIVRKVLATLGVKLHEIQDAGDKFSGLGWEFAVVLDSWRMICPVDKYAIVCGYLKEWTAPGLKSLSLDTVRKACGLLSWVADGWPVGHSDLAHLIHMRTIGEAVARRNPRLSPPNVLVKVTVAARGALLFWRDHFLRWDRSLRVHHDFGPCHAWECLGQVDASTDWGWGGILVTSDSSPILWANHQWLQSERDEAFVIERESTGALELMGAHQWLLAFGAACSNKRLLLEMDNRESARALASGYSPCARIMPLIRKIRVLCVSLSINFRVCHVLGVPFNAVADLLSHDRVPEAHEACSTAFRRPMLRSPTMR
jgi:hypothetical protein